MSDNVVFLEVGNFTTPTDTRECREVIWSDGKSCKKCPVKCYRNGWNKSQVRADNKRIVTNRMQELFGVKS